MTDRVVLFILLLFSVRSVFAQEHQEPIFQEEKMDSVSSLSIKPIKSPYKLLKRVIKQTCLDNEQKHKTHEYQVEATFSRDNLASFSVSCIVTAEAGVGLDRNTVIQKFRYTGPYELTRTDSSYITGYLKQFALLSPVHVPALNAVVMSKPSSYVRPMGIYLGEVLYPLKRYRTTTYYYDVAAYRIDDASGRGVFRIHFARNREKRLFKLAGKKYDLGEVTGTAYFDSQTLHMTQFWGKARLLSHKHDVNLRYHVTYDGKDNMPVLKRTVIVWEGGGTVVKATVQRISN